MNASVITFWTLIVSGYVWAAVQVAAGEPFDALVLWAVTLSYQMYRNAVVRLRKEQT